MNFIKLEYVDGLVSLINLSNVGFITFRTKVIRIIFNNDTETIVSNVAGCDKEVKGCFQIKNFDEVKELLLKISEN